MHTTKIDIIRHGEPIGGSRYRGHGVDDPLSDTGWKQMWAAVGETIDWSRVVTSPLRRCYDFAEALSLKRDLPLEVNERIKEVGFGSWEGRERKAVIKEDFQAYKRFHADPVNARPQGAEPLEVFFDRVTQAVREIIATYPGEHLLVVAHAGVIRSVVSMVLGGALQSLYAINVDYARITRITHSPHLGMQLDFHARTQVIEDN